MRYVRVLIAAVIFAAAAVAEPGPDPSADSELLERYLCAAQSQQARLRGVTMEVDISARIPKLKKEGRLHALRNISRLGQITYNALRFVGDNTIKKDVIARYLTAETHAQEDGSSLAISPENYKFKYKGESEREGLRVHIFQLSPRKKRVGLFKGEVWVDTGTFMPVRESGRLVKNPSMFLRKVEFVRVYEIRDGVAVPKHISSLIETRIVGKAEVTMNFSNYAWVESEPVTASTAADGP